MLQCEAGLIKGPVTVVKESVERTLGSEGRALGLEGWALGPMERAPAEGGLYGFLQWGPESSSYTSGCAQLIV